VTECITAHEEMYIPEQSQSYMVHKRKLSLWSRDTPSNNQKDYVDASMKVKSDVTMSTTDNHFTKGTISRNGRHNTLGITPTGQNICEEWNKSFTNMVGHHHPLLQSQAETAGNITRPSNNCYYCCRQLNNMH